MDAIAQLNAALADLLQERRPDLLSQRPPHHVGLVRTGLMGALSPERLRAAKEGARK